MHLYGFNFSIFNKYYRFLIIFTLVLVICYYNSVKGSIFQDPPKPLDVWMDPFSKPNTFEQPFFWKKKNFGQWCRNFTMNM